jgi:hypothetical protein
MAGKTNYQIIAELKLKTDTYWRYKRMLMEECNIEFKAKADSPNLELGLSTAILHDRLSDLYSLCLQRLNNTDKTDKGYSDLVEVIQEIEINIFRLETQGVQAAISIAKQNPVQTREEQETNKDTSTYFTDGRSEGVWD